MLKLPFKQASLLVQFNNKLEEVQLLILYQFSSFFIHITSIIVREISMISMEM